jgi:chromosome condensin MukBEF ATPase and DNA-binding subunit MukB
MATSDLNISSIKFSPNTIEINFDDMVSVAKSGTDANGGQPVSADELKGQEKYQALQKQLVDAQSIPNMPFAGSSLRDNRVGELKSQIGELEKQYPALATAAASGKGAGAEGINYAKSKLTDLKKQLIDASAISDMPFFGSSIREGKIKEIQSQIDQLKSSFPALSSTSTATTAPADLTYAKTRQQDLKSELSKAKSIPDIPFFGSSIRDQQVSTINRQLAQIEKDYPELSRTAVALEPASTVKTITVEYAFSDEVASATNLGANPVMATDNTKESYGA